jgi:hypothetical protein
VPGRGHGGGADPIDDTGLRRQGAMGALFAGIRAPSTPGSHLRCCTWGNVAQLEKAGPEFPVNLAGRAPLLPGADVLAFVDIDSMQKRVYGHKKQGARSGHTKIQGKSADKILQEASALSSDEPPSASGPARPLWRAIGWPRP